VSHASAIITLSVDRNPKQLGLHINPYSKKAMFYFTELEVSLNFREKMRATYWPKIEVDSF
jgi:hypothetical protein